MEKEQLKPWPDPHLAKRYILSESGRPSSLFNKKNLRDAPLILKVSKGKNGYLKVNIGYPNKRCFYIHRIVCLAFNGPQPTINHIVGHMDGDIYNNHFSNLSWITHKENQAHRRLHGTMANRDNLHNAKINSRMAEAIKNLHRDHSLSASQLGRAFGVRYQTIQKIIKAPNELPPVPIKKDTAEQVLKDLLHFHPRFNYDEDVEAIKWLIERARKLLVKNNAEAKD